MRDRLMTFIDGSNLLIATGTFISASVRSDKPTDDAINLIAMIVSILHERLSKEAYCHGFRKIRSYWFGSFKGTDEYGNKLKNKLRSCGFEPVIFKQKGGKEKRVDIALAREMLFNAFGGNYDLGLLVAGDEDYVDLVNDLKRLGVRILGSFYENGLSPVLRLSFDHFHALHIWGDQRQEFVKRIGGILPK
jgi:uncharacterized LabA/DUF88 family protein